MHDIQICAINSAELYHKHISMGNWDLKIVATGWINVFNFLPQILVKGDYFRKTFFFCHHNLLLKCFRKQTNKQKNSFRSNIKE